MDRITESSHKHGIYCIKWNFTEFVRFFYMNPACVSAWMKGADMRFPLLHTYWSVLHRFSVSLNKDINTWTTSPKLLLLSFIEHLTVSFEKTLKSHYIYIYKQNSPRQPSKSKFGLTWRNLGRVGIFFSWGPKKGDLLKTVRVDFSILHFKLWEALPVWVSSTLK